MSRRAFALALALTFAAGVFMRVAWLRADPPVQDSVGVVWHDEGAWVHNARNRALWGTWRTDAWNPVFVAPVFTALEYASFRTFGVGLWQARAVPVASGILAIACLVAGLSAAGGRRAAALGGALLATNYAFVMWNRAALMESTMTAALVAAWAAYAASARRPWWGTVAGIAAVAAWFTKASAAFFLAALVLDAATTVVRAHARGSADEASRRLTRAAWLSFGGLALAGGIAGVLFVAPYWADYRFYNWQMSVTRKPEDSLHALEMRASWLPFVQNIFSHAWLVVAGAAVSILAIVGRWWDAKPAERLLVLWVLVGFVELIVHDSGNERRYVMFIPPLIALASLLVARPWAETWGSTSSTRAPSRVVTLVVAMPLAYVVIGSLIRPLWRDQIEAGRLHGVVVVSAALSMVAALVAAAVFPVGARPAIRPRLGASLAGLWVCTALGVHVVEYALWVPRRATTNYEASLQVGRLLPPGTLVQGKLANGLSLENRIRPIFVGNGFGNYDDRLRRDDVRYILTYDLPRLGYESSDGSGLIQGILDQYPQHRTLAAIPVDETPGPDRAILIDKLPDVTPHARN